MKKIFSFCVMLIAISTVTFASADKPTSATGMAIVRNGSTFSVFYKAEHQADVKVCIYDAKDQLVFTETLRKVNGFIRPYNFSALPEGDYTIDLSLGEKHQVEKVSYYAGKVEKLGNLIPLAGQQNKYLFTFPNKGNNVITLSIVDEESNEQLYTSTEKIVGNFARVFNLEKVKGDLVLQIIDKDGKTYSINF